MVEMALLVSLIAIVALASTKQLGKEVKCTFQGATDQIFYNMTPENAALCCSSGMLCNLDVPPACSCFGFGG